MSWSWCQPAGGWDQGPRCPRTRVGPPVNRVRSWAPWLQGLGNPRAGVGLLVGRISDGAGS